MFERKKIPFKLVLCHWALAHVAEVWVGLKSEVFHAHILASRKVTK